MVAEERVVVGFVGDVLVGRGRLAEIATACLAHATPTNPRRIAMFDDDTGRTVEMSLSPASDLASPNDAAPRAETPRRPGRPKLGVVSREISLLPKHWEWLSEQRLGASATIRRLVDAAMKQDTGVGMVRKNIDAAHRFMWDIAGDKPDFEEATRALFACNFDRFSTLIAPWPDGIRDQLMRFVARAQKAHSESVES